jgi:hypothetical protein
LSGLKIVVPWGDTVGKAYNDEGIKRHSSRIEYIGYLFIANSRVAREV